MKKAKILKNVFLNDDVFSLQLKSEENFNFIAGQFVTFKINDGKEPQCFRAYSISSAPSSNNEFEVCIKIVEMGRGSNFLSTLKENDEIEYIGPAGHFTLNKNNSNELFFVGTGTGVAPLKSMIEEKLKNDSSTKITLLFGVRYESDVFYYDHFKELEKNNKNFKFILSLSRPSGDVKNDNMKFLTGRVTNYLEKTILNANTSFYICGLKDMIESVNELLLKKGIKQENINFEKFN